MGIGAIEIVVVGVLIVAVCALLYVMSGRK